MSKVWIEVALNGAWSRRLQGSCVRPSWRRRSPFAVPTQMFESRSFSMVRICTCLRGRGMSVDEIRFPSQRAMPLSVPARYALAICRFKTGCRSELFLASMIRWASSALLVPRLVRLPLAVSTQ